MRRKLVVAAVAAVSAACAPEGSTGGGATTDEALSYFHLARSGEGKVSYGASKAEGDAQVFTDVVFEGSDGSEARAETLRLVGARETPDGVLFDAVEVHGLTAGDAESDVRIDRVILEEPNALLASFIAQVLSDEGVAEDADWGKMSDYAFGTLAFEGLGVRGTEGGEVSLASLRFEGLSQGVLGGFVLEDLTGGGQADGSGFDFALDSWRMRGLDLTSMDAFAGLDPDDDASVQRAFAESGFNDPFRKWYDAVDVSGLHLDVDGVILALDSLSAAMKESDAGLESTERMSGLTVTFDDSRELGRQALAGLALLGYDSIEINGEFASVADRVNDRLTTDSNALRIKDALTLEIDYDISGIRAYYEAAAKLGYDGASSFDAGPTPEEMAALFAPLIINGFQLRVIDDTFVDRALQAQATSQGTTPEQVRETMVALMSLAPLATPPGRAQELVSQAIDAASTFLETPGTLVIAMDPAEPVPLAAFMEALEAEDLDRALGLVNVRIEATP